MVYQNHILIDFQFSVIYLTNADSAHVFIIINGTDQNLGIRIWIAFWSRNIFDDGIKQRHHIFRSIS